MNREQMIAWLTLEGWEPTDDSIAYRGMVNRALWERIYCVNPGEALRNRNGAKDHHISAITTWDTLDTADIKAMYRLLDKEKNHEPR